MINTAIVVIFWCGTVAYSSDIVPSGTIGSDNLKVEKDTLCTVCDGPWHVNFARVALALAENNFDFAQKRKTKIESANFIKVPKAELARQIEKNLRLRQMEMDEDLLAFWQNYQIAVKSEISLFHDDFAANLSQSANSVFDSIRTVIGDDNLSQWEECEKIIEILSQNPKECREIQSQDDYSNRVDAFDSFGAIAPSYVLATVSDKERKKFLNILLNENQLSVPLNEIKRQLSETWMPRQFDEITEIYVDDDKSASDACAQISVLVPRLEISNAKKSDFARVIAHGAKNCGENFLAFRFLYGYGRFASDKTFFELLTLKC